MTNTDILSQHIPKRILRMRVGARVWKTALAVTVAIGISRLLNIDQPVFAGVAAIICMQPTVAGSVRSGINRMQATIIGAVFSLLALIALQELPALAAVRPAVVGLTVLVVMAVTLYLEWLDSLVLAAATVVVIMVLPPDENIYFYSLTRTMVTFVGIVVATGVNAIFITPRYTVPLRQNIARLTESTGSVYRDTVLAFCSRDADLAREAEKSLAESEELLTSVETTMEWMQEEERLRRTIRRSPGHDAEVLAYTLQSIKSVRQSSETILRVTMEILEREPMFAEHSAHVYEILCELAQPGFALFDRIQENLASEPTVRSEDIGACWTDDLHKQFIRGIREHSAEIYPLVEISVVEFEVRRVTEVLAELEVLLAADRP